MVGIADTRLGEEMVAFIKLRSGKTNEWTEKSLKDHFRNKVCILLVDYTIKSTFIMNFFFFVYSDESFQSAKTYSFY